MLFLAVLDWDLLLEDVEVEDPILVFCLYRFRALDSSIISSSARVLNWPTLRAALLAVIAAPVPMVASRAAPLSQMISLGWLGATLLSRLYPSWVFQIHF